MIFWGRGGEGGGRGEGGGGRRGREGGGGNLCPPSGSVHGILTYLELCCTELHYLIVMLLVHKPVFYCKINAFYELSIEKLNNILYQ